MLGPYIREMRQAQGMTLAELGHASFLSTGFLSDVEHGRRRLNPHNASRIADALGIARAELVQPVLERLLENLDLEVVVRRRFRGVP